MSRANLSMFEADLSASWLNLQRILNFYPLKNLASDELFLFSTNKQERGKYGWTKKMEDRYKMDSYFSNSSFSTYI